jgi:hypothetical protein
MTGGLVCVSLCLRTIFTVEPDRFGSSSRGTFIESLSENSFELPKECETFSQSIKLS